MPHAVEFLPGRRCLTDYDCHALLLPHGVPSSRAAINRDQSPRGFPSEVLEKASRQAGPETRIARLPSSPQQVAGQGSVQALAVLGPSAIVIDRAVSSLSPIALSESARTRAPSKTSFGFHPHRALAALAAGPYIRVAYCDCERAAKFARNPTERVTALEFEQNSMVLRGCAA